MKRCEFCSREFPELGWLKIPDCLPGYMDWEGPSCETCCRNWVRDQIFPHDMRVKVLHAMRTGFLLEVEADIQDDGSVAVRSVSMSDQALVFADFQLSLQEEIKAAVVEEYLKGRKRV